MFEQLKVIELASVLAGPAVGLFFAELGAQVLKIENKRTQGDVTRRWRLPSEKNDPQQLSAYYCSVNWNKETLLLDLSTPEDQKKVHTLVADADIVIANFKQGAAQKLHMDAKTLTALNPQLIYGAITGFEQGNNRVAFDVVLQAETGFMYMNGQPEGPPTKMPVALIDVLAAHQLKEGLLVALLQRAKTGKGQIVTVSLVEAAIASLANQATNWLMGGHIPQRMGSLHPNIAPYGEIFKCKGGEQVVLAIGTEKQFKSLCHILNIDNIAIDNRFSENAQRVKNRTALTQILEQAFLLKDATPLLEWAHANALPIGEIKNMQQVFETPIAKSMILEQQHETGQLSKRAKTAIFKINAV